MIGTKQRFGLFSQPISTAIGDDGPYKAKLRIFYIIQIREEKMESQLHNSETFIRILQNMECLIILNL